jgi:hypothetical protein
MSSALPLPRWSCFPGRSAGLKATTFDLLLLHLSLSPQVVDGGLLLLEGLAQIFVRNAELDQFPVELRGLILPLLEGRLRPFERGTLLLEPTQHLFPRQALPLERSLGLGEGSTLLLELGLRLLVVPDGAAPLPRRAQPPCPLRSSSSPRLPWPSPQPDSAMPTPPRGSCGLVGVGRERRRPQAPTPPRRSTPPPDLRVLSATRRPAPP